MTCLRLITALFLIPALCLAPSPAPATDKFPEIAGETDGRVLRSASELDYPPFSVVQKDGSAGGFSVDLLKAVCEAADLKVAFRVGPWNEIKTALAEGRLDVLPLVSYSKTREAVFDFTTPYLRMHGAVFVRKGERTIRGEADLKDRQVLVMRGDTAHEYAVRKKLTHHLILTDTFEEAIRRLSKGQGDAVIIQHLVGLQLVKQLGVANVVALGASVGTSLRPVARPLEGFEQKFCMAVRDGDKALLARLNEGLALVISNGVYDELYDKWFGHILPSPQPSLPTLLKYLAAILVPVLLFSGGLGIWYFKREVARKTLEIKATEASLRESEAWFRLALKNAPVSVAAQDRNLRYTFAYNHRTAWPDEIIGHLDEEIFAPDEAAHITAIKRRVIDEGIESREKMWFSRPNGRVFLDACWEPISDEHGTIVGVATATVDMTSTKLAEEALKASLAEKEVLLKEIHHRVKNNMQVISSLVSLQADTVGNAVIQEVLRDVSHRVRSMALVHERLYQSTDLARIDLAEYAQSLVHYLRRVYDSSGASCVHVATDLEPVSIPVNQAVPCGLILNELVNNAFKHAFPENRPGKINVSLSPDGENGVILKVQDDGQGLPDGFDWRQSGSLGFHLIHLLARQLDASVTAVSHSPSTIFTIEFERQPE